MTKKRKSLLGLKSEPTVIAGTASAPRSFKGVTAETIGEGFEVVDESIFDTPKNAVFVTSFKNKFITGRSKFITYTASPVLKYRRPKKEVKQAFNAHTKVSKNLRRTFSESLGENIKSWREMFVNDILPATLSIQTASEEVKEQLQQLVDDNIHIPVDYINVKTLQAVQLRIVRAVVEQFGLTPREAELMITEFLPKPLTINTAPTEKAK